MVFLYPNLIAQGSCRNVRAFCYTQICPGHGVKL
nr:MAG TPA: Neural chondroitin sulfate proteoglycan cytoplasmic domain protein [Caudoviricetes sp.]